MVQISKPKPTEKAPPSWQGYLPIGIGLILTLLFLPRLLQAKQEVEAKIETQLDTVATSVSNNNNNQQQVIASTTVKEEDATNNNNNNNGQCPYMALNDLTPEELRPVAGPRHMVTPPDGGTLHLVCCQTTKGPFNTLVHEKWAPKGANRFLDMVNTGYFDATVPLMRCVKNFICQFGLNSNKDLSTKYRPNLEDDPNWLPEGPAYRTNEQGVVRFAQGYMAYAGGGTNSRTNQLIISLVPVETLAGGSPWYVCK